MPIAQFVELEVLRILEAEVQFLLGTVYVGMAKLADAPDLGSGVERHKSSILFTCTKYKMWIIFVMCFFSP